SSSGRATARVAANCLAVATDVAVLAPHDDHNRVGLADVAEPAWHLWVDADEAARLQRVPRPVAEAKLDVALVDEIGLFLLIVEMLAGLVARREDERVDTEGGHVELTTDLAKTVTVADLAEARHGIACSFTHREQSYSSARNLGPGPKARTT